MKRRKINMEKFKRIAILIFVLFASVGCDQATKAVAQRRLSAQPLSYLNDLFRLQYVQNNGAFLSFGSFFSEQARFWVFTILVSIFLLGLLFFALRIAQQVSFVTLIALALLLGGGGSNLMDRIFHHGLVVDFMNIGIGPIRTGIFNVADMAIMAGLALLLLTMNRAAAQKSTPHP
jgi:signal peptidase II